MWSISKVRGPWKTEAPLQRERGRLREIVIEIEPLCVVYRLQGTRRRYRLTHAKAYQLAAMAEADAARVRRRTVKRGALAKGA